MVDVVRAFVSGDLGVAGGYTEPTVDLYAAGESDWVTAAVRRMETWTWVAGIGAIALLAARRRVLEEPGNHLRLLRWTAVLGIAIGWACSG